MVFLVDALVFVLGCVLLVKSANLLVKSTVKLAVIFKLTEFTIGFMLVSIATSIPDIFVCTISSLRGFSGFALGDVMGSNIMNLTLVVGIAVLIKGEINIYSRIVLKDCLLMVLIVTIPLLLMLDQSLSQIDGIILLSVFVLYMLRLYGYERKFEKKLEERAKRKDELKYFALFAVSVLLLLFSSQVIITAAGGISAYLGIPQIMIGLVLLAIGTTLPEIIFVTSASLKHEYLAIGDILGSVISTSTLVLGIAAVIRPIEGDFIIFLTSAMFMVMAAFLFATFVESERSLRIKEGMALLLLYILFLIIEFNIQLFQMGVPCMPCT